MNEFIAYLKNNDWCIKFYETPLTDEEVKSALSRYPFVSGEYLEFLKTVKFCVNRDGHIYFNCIDDFTEKSQNDFQWNEFEEAFYLFADNEEQCNEMAEFWKSHLPIVIIAKDTPPINQYNSKNNYYALRSDGKVIKGYGYKYNENDNVVADSFEQFILMVLNEDNSPEWK